MYATPVWYGGESDARKNRERFGLWPGRYDRFLLQVLGRSTIMCKKLLMLTSCCVLVLCFASTTIGQHPEAYDPIPEDGATNVNTPVTLRWTPGDVVVLHDLYLGTDEAAVAARDMSTFKGKLVTAEYDTGPLELFSTYYWAVDEFTPIGTVAGAVWRFSTPKYLIIEDGETTLNYDNTAEPYVSEAAFDTPMDMTAEGAVADVTLRFKGAPSNLSVDEATGTYEVAGAGADIWGNADQFHYVYKELTGDATIVARVVDNGTGSNAWAKGGVMIRESIAPDSKHAIMAMTGGDGGGIAFQARPETAGSSWGLQGDITAAPPHWVRLTRAGNTITGEHSADGVTWELMTDTSPDGAMTDPIDIEMADPVLVGLFVTSHAAGEVRTYTIDNVSIEGDVSADFVSEDVDSVSGNSAAPVYVALEDMLGAVATVVHPNPAATMIEDWRQWTVPLSEFAGVDPTLAAKLYVGVGDGEPGGAGALNVSEIRVVQGSPDIIWVTGNYDDNADGLPDDQAWASILEAQGYNVDYGKSYVTLDDDAIAELNAAKLIIVSRNSNSGDYDDGDEIAQWNAITTPIINSSTHVIRSSRWKWFDSTSILSLTPATMVLADGTEVSGIDDTVGPASFMDAGPGNGVVLATGDGLPWIVEWEAGVEYYDGAGEIAGGPRMFFAAGTQESAPTIGRGEMNLTAGALKVFIDAVNKYAASDVTVPGDIVKGNPDEARDGSVAGWPPNEHPALAIDDNVNTKYLHFKGEVEPTGLKITPLDGPSIVTGLTLTTANDAEERDPISFELSGSNGDIDGPYELIASGEIVDFNQADAWPRFTKNATPIMFANAAAYAHYQLMFPTVRDAASANSMQIAEIELLGTLAPSHLISVLRSGGVSGDRDPIGAYDGNTQPLPTEPGGLMDGNLVFSDRTYPWAGIPAEYRGSEYIRTFNSDKNGGTVDAKYEVTIARDAIVWVTIDDRIPAEWNAGGAIASPQDAADYVTAQIGPAGTFTDTGIDIYVREASDGSNDRPMSVYAAELLAGTYVFTSMDSGKNFYTVGAIE